MLVNCGELVCGAIEYALMLSEAKDMGERYRTLQRDASDIIMLIDRNTGQLIEVNRKCCEALGYTEDELLCRSFFDLFPREDQVQARRDFVNVLSQKSRTFVDRRLTNRDGSIIFVDISASIIELKNDTFIQALVHDISQRRMLEQQIIMQNKNLHEANRKLREVDEMKTEFLGNISHELRTPLSIIIAYSEAMRDPALPEKERGSFVDIIAENGEHLLKLINDLLDLSNLEISGAMLSMSLSHVHDVVRSLWSSVQTAAEKQGITLVFLPGNDVPVTYIDNRRIEQVITCLVQNGIKFSDEGGRVEVRTVRTSRGVRVEVEDWGLGIPSEKLPHIFETFHQIDGSATRRWGGMGIGLTMAKHIVELHGGNIEVESESDKGSTFTFVIPVDPDTAFAADESKRELLEDATSPAE
ncbi:MAG: PAS domain S-box protein [Candidatus Krumholzibacteriota bacterium]|nr:PAS domain S-box protein [Candidatus Krumholzibacteriota bacterium]